ncbi:MFS transporter [Vulcanisaeta distributa]|uniref:General substrate transporter n=1 Tax=Vulcanisaeta distributa (strain DSM 14429 / JCM 11212 / NBRC 100878 / IC-017) TaxID=572478 RepID=E1QSL9_VULDI|nr:MFS transporter [Vulcanisaeta distributa]ADN50812.1 General substrate transporter [Vulcanisaeta distributa DSM 14429]
MSIQGSLESIRRRAIISAYLGWVMDGYDALLVTPIMPLLGELFFPGPYSLLGGLSTLVATLIGRPLGSVIMGYVGDRFGRRVGLLITVLGYSLSALVIALLPTYAVIGVLAPLTLLALRFLQGVFLGGEWGPGTAMIMEWSRWGKEVTSAFVQSGYPIGVVIATMVNVMFLTYMGPIPFNAYGWRIYMGTGAVVAVLAFIIRSRLVESPLWSRPKANPLTLLFKRGGAWLGYGILFTGGLLTIYYSTYLIYSDFLKVIGAASIIPSVMLISTIAAVIAVLLAGPLALAISYRWFIIGTLMISLAYAPIALLLYPNFINLVILAFIENFAMGLVPYVLIDKFDVQYRASGLGVSYNWGLLIGGWAPMIVGLISPMGLGMVVMMAVGVTLAIIGLLMLSRASR